MYFIALSTIIVYNLFYEALHNILGLQLTGMWKHFLLDENIKNYIQFSENDFICRE